MLLKKGEFARKKSGSAASSVVFVVEELSVQCPEKRMEICAAKKIREDIHNRVGLFSYPTVIIDDKILITGFKESQIRETYFIA